MECGGCHLQTKICSSLKICGWSIEYINVYSHRKQQIGLKKNTSKQSGERKKISDKSTAMKPARNWEQITLWVLQVNESFINMLKGLPAASLGLEATERKTQPYLAMCNWGGSEATEYRPLICMEESNQLGVLAISGGHGNAQEEYAMRRRSRPIRQIYRISAARVGLQATCQRVQALSTADESVRP